MLQLDDDTILLILTFACDGPQNICIFRSVCKRLHSLSRGRLIWSNLYASGRAFGPLSWHSTTSLQEHVVRYHRITRNLESASPKFTKRIHCMVYNSPYHDPLVHGRFFFMARLDRTLVCLDMDMGLKQLWEHRWKDLEPGDPLTVRFCDIALTDKPFFSSMTLFVQSGVNVMLVYLDVIHEPKGSVRLIETKTNVISIPNKEVLYWKQDWIILGPLKQLSFFNIHTSRRYRPDVPADSTYMTSTFVGDRYIVAMFSSIKGAVVAVFSLPEMDAASHLGGIECISLFAAEDIPYSGDGRVSFCEELRGPWYHHRTDTIIYPLNFLIEAVYAKPVECGVVLGLAVLRFSIAQNDANSQMTFNDIECPQDVLKEYISQHHSWVVGLAQYGFGVTYLFTPVSTFRRRTRSVLGHPYRSN